MNFHLNEFTRSVFWFQNLVKFSFGSTNNQKQKIKTFVLSLFLIYFLKIATIKKSEKNNKDMYIGLMT